MIARTVLFVFAASLSVGGCEVSDTQYLREPPPAVLTASEHNCLDYGFVVGTTAYDRCVAREHAIRQGYVPRRDYSEAALAADARAACYSYGLEPGTWRYDRCVGREIDARRYRDAAETSYVPAPAVVYQRPPYVETRNADTAGIPAFKDEYGFRYDAQGNRLDRYGNIISPHTTTP